MWISAILLGIICAQFIGILYLLSERSCDAKQVSASATFIGNKASSLETKLNVVPQFGLESNIEARDNWKDIAHDILPSNQSISSGIYSVHHTVKSLLNLEGSLHHNESALEGVAAIVLLHAPMWFQRRYTYIIMNCLDNLPDKWKLQVFYTQSGQSQAGIDLNTGLGRLVSKDKILLTAIPKEVHAQFNKKYELMQSKWLWNNMVADKVFIFSGNAVICTNSKYTLSDFASFDYIGSPWDAFKGEGGDGGVSIRSRKLMLRVLDHESSGGSQVMRESQEDHFFISRIQKMRKTGTITSGEFRIATREDTLRFSAIGSASNKDVLVVSGTLPGLNDIQREQFMQTCPEMKIMFPSIHSPHCFGARVDSDKCALSICATSRGPGYHGSC